MGGSIRLEWVAALNRNTHFNDRKGASVIIGGKGDDQIVGGDNSTVYFERGDGRDTISVSDGSSILFGQGITLVDLVVSHDAYRHYIDIGGGDRLTINSQFAQVQFQNGTILTQQEIYALDPLAGTAGNDLLYGTSSNDEASGGDGSDQLLGYAGNDKLYGGNGNDFIDGGSGDDSIYGGADNDNIDGGAGNDGLWGEQGSDTYYFGRGSGQDFIFDALYQRNTYGKNVNPGDTDTIKLSLLPQEVLLTRGGGVYGYSHLIISIVGTTDFLVVSEWFNQENIYGTLKLEFSDGTIWDAASIEAHSAVRTGTTGSDNLYGGPNGDHLAGLSGNDNLYGNAGNDVLDGGGNSGGYGDQLYGGEGDDTYFFGYGSGQVRVTEYELIDSNELVGSGNDTIQFAVGVRPQDVILEQYFSDLRIKLVGSTDMLTLSGRFGDDYSRIERAVFSDGTVWDLTKSLNGPVTGTVNGETLTGGVYDDAISGLGGNDTLNGKDGFDTLSGGDGNDTLDGGNGNDLLLGGAGDDNLF
jgi:Ca2+-binding RTX toxin-like protein